MTILIVGATGATGRLLLEELLNRGLKVKVIVRLPDKLAENIRQHANLTVIQADVLTLSDSEMTLYVKYCNAIASCLGHNLNFKGIFGHPRLLVTEATRRLCEAIKANRPEKPVRFVLMNTVGNSNRDIPEPISLAQKGVLGLMRLFLPPHADNEQAADYLRATIGKNDGAIEWVAVRPDSLLNENKVTPYNVYPSPIRSAIFNAGVTSRINVGHFMADLLTNDEIWHKWKGQMPVIYNNVLS